jgi:hypothetical protein
MLSQMVEYVNSQPWGGEAWQPTIVYTCVGYFLCQFPAFARERLAPGLNYSAIIHCFWHIKERTQRKVLRQDPSRPRILHTGWSNVGIGAVMTKNDLVVMLARWANTLQQYTFEVILYRRPGVNHQNADCVSCLPEESSTDTTGARSLNEQVTLLHSMLGTQLAALHASIYFTILQWLYDLSPKPDFVDTFAPTSGDMISICTNTPITAKVSALSMYAGMHLLSCTRICELMQMLPARGGTTVSQRLIPFWQHHATSCRIW